MEKKKKDVDEPYPSTDSCVPQNTPKSHLGLVLGSQHHSTNHLGLPSWDKKTIIPLPKKKKKHQQRVKEMSSLTSKNQKTTLVSKPKPEESVAQQEVGAEPAAAGVQATAPPSRNGAPSPA